METSAAIPWNGWRIPRRPLPVPGTEPKMTDVITVGSILVEEGTRLPESLPDQGEANSNGWAAVEGARRTFEKAVQEAGWTFFYHGGRDQGHRVRI